MIDDRILEQGDEREFLNRRKVFGIIYDAMESEMIMKESLPICKLKNDNPSTIRFPIMGSECSYDYIEMKVRTIKFDSGLSKDLIDLDGKDIIDIKLKRMGKKIAYEFNVEILKTIVNLADRDNDVIIDNVNLTQNDLNKSINKCNSNEIIMYSNTENENIHGMYEAIKLGYRNDQFCYYGLSDKYPILITLNYEKAGLIGMSSLMLECSGDKILENLDTLQASLRFGVSIFDPKAISVLLDC